MEIIFMRHGKAQAREAGLPDDNRRLTGKGRRRVRQAARSLTCGFVRLQNVRIWTSPLKRAKETAEIIAKGMKVEKVQFHPAIATGDLDALLKDLRNLPEKAVVIIVGHEPYLGIWVNRFTQAEVPFTLASVAAVKIASLDPPAGRLRWFASSSLLADLAKKNG